MPSANATLILDAIPGVLTDLYPLIPVQVRKGEPGPDPADPTSGWNPGNPTTTFVVSCLHPEGVDAGIAAFENIFVRYTVDIVYVKPFMASPGRWEEDPDIRSKRQEIRARLYRPTFPEVEGVFDNTFKAGPVYQVLGGAKPPLIASVMSVSFLTVEDREFNEA